MSWIRNSPLRGSFGNRRRPSNNSPPKDCDPTACFNSFREHWLQTSAIIDRTQPPESFPIQDDVLAVVNHLDQMVTLLLLELRSTATSSPEFQSQHQCLDFLLCENLLERLFDWSVHTGRYCNLLRMEQLKLYELLACQARQQLLLHQPFLRPLLRLLASCLGEVFSTDVEDRLVVLLNQLCVCLMHNTELLQLFFHADAPDQGPARFIIFSLLIPFVHREGAVGQQARDALLLCMTLSKQHEGVGRYIAQESNVCLVLATGLSGLYSRLPRKLPVQTDDWHRLTPDDVKDIEELATFMNSLEFCNAVAQVAHPEVRHQLLDFLTQGFLVPVQPHPHRQKRAKSQSCGRTGNAICGISKHHTGTDVSFVFHGICTFLRTRPIHIRRFPTQFPSLPTFPTRAKQPVRLPSRSLATVLCGPGSASLTAATKRSIESLNHNSASVRLPGRPAVAHPRARRGDDAGGRRVPGAGRGDADVGGRRCCAQPAGGGVAGRVRRAAAPHRPRRLRRRRPRPHRRFQPDAAGLRRAAPRLARGDGDGHGGGGHHHHPGGLQRRRAAGGGEPAVPGGHRARAVGGAALLGRGQRPHRRRGHPHRRPAGRGRRRRAVRTLRLARTPTRTPTRTRASVRVGDGRLSRTLRKDDSRSTVCGGGVVGIYK